MMSALNPSHATLFLVLIFSFKLSQCVAKNTIFCPEIEKQSLVNFKISLKDPGHTLLSWDSEVNCCKWRGVVCNNLTGHVHQLHLQSNPYTFQGLSGKLNPSLLNLKYLRYLDLSLNNFGETIPSFIGSFTYLEYLNLSLAGFHGKIPHTLGNLSHLYTLDLAGDPNDGLLDLVKYRNQLDGDRLEWLSGLSKLEHLNMNCANLSRATNWPQVINTVPSLLQLHFQYCRLEYAASLNDVNITSLEFLDLSMNYNFNSTLVPSWIFQLSNLLYLDIHWNFYIGPIPTISNATKLQHIDLSNNDFNSSIPDWPFLCKDLEFFSLSGNLQGTIPNAIGNLTSLETLDLGGSRLSGKIPREIFNLCKLKQLVLSDNELQGEIADSFGNMSECFLQALEVLELNDNQFSGQLTDAFGEFKRLRVLRLSGNSLSGAIPISLGKLASVESLFLHNNKFSGNLPESLGQLSNLRQLLIEDNMLEGVVSEAHFANLTKLERILASRNRLTLRVGANWIPPFKLWDLELGSWNLGESSQILSWLETQKEELWDLDLSNTGISGNIPGWIWEIQFDYLNLSHNQLQGKIPHIGGAEYVYLSCNQFSGSLPPIIEFMKELDLSNNSFSGGMSHFLCNGTYETYELEILHLGGNQLDGELPDCWMKWPALIYLNLGDNNISRSIPNSFGYLSDLESLNLYGNKFSSHIPSSMRNCTQLLKIDLARNDLNGSIPTWMGTTLLKLQFLILRSNKLSGEIPPTLCHLNSLQILDFSDNKLSGIIPRCVDNFTAMATKRSLDSQRASYSDRGDLIDSASIDMKGSELQYDTILYLVTTIDLSQNNLSGDIPKEFTSLVELRSLNLSQNNFTGSIPEKIGDMKQLESLDFSRNSLSGQIPSSFTLISSLSHLNLSYNNLSGKIPQGTQLQGFDASSFIGNNLCGPPSTSNCDRDGDEVRPGHKDEDGSDDSKIEWVYVFLSSGYAVGLAIVCSVLVLNKPWREAYFGWLECLWDNLYVFFYVNWRRLFKPSTAFSE
ncbi:hypothetical protein C2S53_012400 [Perilla frutescens var. hirtella]|uniref:Leucine-rich repeat-containing N-terminal plant-type domain-containing protein n=1 Tax=Perilla frutescens var. hirtella TaxID=608512 RepID=A0AAD4JKP2_PERFH|nr:hypothetical protein C2S53_012400 [Perilla frutescens var. hirtella]